jgi:prepilin-type N-terminal cleavage/methylation domain-containing protein
MRADTKPGRTAGFTLLEVMVAVAILAVGVVPLLVTHATTVSNIRRGRELTVAGLMARERLAELEVYGFSALADEAGLFEPPGSSGPGSEPHPALKLEEGVEEIELAALLEAKVEVNRRNRPTGKEDDQSEVTLATYIVNLYFEPEETDLDE